MRVRRFEFPYESLAEAFMQGVEYVNDSAISAVIEPHTPGKPWVVACTDQDGNDDSDYPPSEDSHVVHGDADP